MSNEINLNNLAQHFSTEEAARELIEKMRWPDGTICPHCNAMDAFKIQAKAESKTGARKGL